MDEIAEDQCLTGTIDQVATVVEDLRNIVEYIVNGIASIVFQPLRKSNGSLWAIRGAKQNLVVMLQYENESELMQTDVIDDVICTKSTLNESHLIDLQAKETAAVATKLLCHLAKASTLQSSICNATSWDDVGPKKTCNSIVLKAGEDFVPEYCRTKRKWENSFAESSLHRGLTCNDTLRNSNNVDHGVNHSCKELEEIRLLRTLDGFKPHFNKESEKSFQEGDVGIESHYQHNDDQQILVNKTNMPCSGAKIADDEFSDNSDVLAVVTENDKLDILHVASDQDFVVQHNKCDQLEYSVVDTPLSTCRSHSVLKSLLQDFSTFRWNESISNNKMTESHTSNSNLTAMYAIAARQKYQVEAEMKTHGAVGTCQVSEKPFFNSQRAPGEISYLVNIDETNFYSTLDSIACSEHVSNTEDISSVLENTFTNELSSDVSSKFTSETKKNVVLTPHKQMLAECKTYISIKREIPIVQDDDAEKLLQLLNKNSTSSESKLREGDASPGCQQRATSHTESENQYLNNLESYKIKKCFVLLELLDMTILENNYKAVVVKQEPEQCTVTIKSDPCNVRNSVRCIHCRMSFGTSDDLKVHVETGETFYECSDCCFRLAGKIPDVGIYPRDVFCCTECGMKFRDLDCFNNHLQTHNAQLLHFEVNDLQQPLHVKNGGKWWCTLCGKTFPYRCLLEYHKLTHTGEKRFACSYCGHRFNDKSTLNKHVLIHTGEKPFECPHCGKRFNRKSSMTQHKLLHSNEKLYKCSQCDKSFTQKSGLNQHQQLHRGKELHECSYCGHKFTEKSSLKKHLIIHTGEKPFECLQCNKRFIRNRALKMHQRFHTGEKRYVCLYCGHKFTDKSTLNKHVVIHTGEKPFECLHCGRRFNRRSSLNKHNKLLHGGEKRQIC